MPSGAKQCSAARSPSQLEGSSYLRQFEGSLCSFHVAYLFLVQFLLNIFIGNILSDLQTRITVTWSDYDFHYVKKLPRILISIERVIPNTARYSVMILRLCDSGTRSETKFSEKIFKRNWLRMRFAAWNGLKLQVSVQQLCGPLQHLKISCGCLRATVWYPTAPAQHRKAAVWCRRTAAWLFKS